MKKLSIFLLITIMLTSFGGGEIVQAGGLDRISQNVDNFIEERKEGTASVSMGVFKAGEMVHKTQYGYIDVENRVPANEDAIYEWGSVSKVLVWISLMQLEEVGKIDLTEDVKTYLPEDFASELKYPHPITFMDIMNLQSSFQELGVKTEYEENEAIPPLDQLLIDSEPVQIYEPGTVTAYNNWTPALAAYVVESLTGQKFYDYVRENIFRPLGMEHTAVAADWSDNPYAQKNRPKSKSYYYTSEDHESLGTSILHVGLYPAGACAGTFDDFLIFATEFTKDHPRFFKEASTFEDMKEASALYEDGLPKVHHGLLSLDDTEHLIGHSGNTQGFTSSFWFEPKTQTGYAVMTNEPGETAYNYGFAPLLFGTSNPEAQESPDISGIYVSRRTIERGTLRFIKYLSGLLPIKSTDKEGVFQIPLVGVTITNMGNHRYHFDNGNGLAYQTVQKAGGGLETFTADYEPLSCWEIISAYTLLLAMLLNLVAMVCRIIYLLVQLLRGRSFKVMTPGMISHIAGSLISMTFIYLWILADSYSKRKLFVTALICVLSSAVILLNFFHQIYNRTKGEENSPLPVTWPLIMPMAVYFYQLYNFWV
ncbi:hypothetical protein ING2D1G_1488 [Peptoniphilus sp. ING2-D1G]|nr:hypothetical protein ING2D1G_1488 [Peptoniphilus sp. ING2-D1G]